MKSEVVSGLANARWPVLVVDPAGVISHANPAALRIFGPAVAQGGVTLASLWPVENGINPVDFLAGADKEGTARIKLKGAGGGVFPFQAGICPMTEGAEKFLLLQLLPQAVTPESPPPAASMDAGIAHKQKLDCALQLARTVSLDFNNALTSILGHTSLVLGRLEPDSPWRSSLIQVEKSAAKAAEIANDLGVFSRQEKENKSQQSGNLNTLLQRNAEMFQTTKMDKEITWTLQLERRLYSAKFDEAKMQQAFVKIMENAIEAITASRGRIIIQTKNLDLTQPTQDRNAQLAAGAYVCTEITDNGNGIEADVLPRIFEPFFTTKRSEKHRGLGLAWVYGIVTNHGGGVAVSSQPGAGTSVRIYLPADKKLVRESVSATTDLNGTETILMVDDEDLLLTMGQAVLSTYGYQVLTANSGPRALEVIASTDRQIDLLITDLVMPNMSGRELVEQVRQASPNTRILCTSGYVRPNTPDTDEASYLQKPFTTQELLQKVKHALGAVESSPVD